jgi:MFS family permease
MLPRTHLLKISEEDLSILFPDDEVELLAARWQAQGVRLIVVTRGAQGVRPNLPLLITSRVIGGVAIGASSVLAPTYLAEIAPAKYRGALVGAFQLNVVFGILVAYLSNYLVGQLDLGADEWRWKFALARR